MHHTANQNLDRFFETYLNDKENLHIVEIGSSNSDIRKRKRDTWTWTGLDIDQGQNVDLVLNREDPYNFPFQPNEVDVIVTANTFEHVEMFWLTWLDGIRILKPNGIFYMTAPSNGHYHTYPVDCWRYYPDSPYALKKWGHRNGYHGCEVMETYTSNQNNDVWNDHVSIWIKESEHAGQYPNRIIKEGDDWYRNGKAFPDHRLFNHSSPTEDQRKLNIQ